MFRHLVRHVAKTGQVQDFVGAFKVLNNELAAAGMPRYRLWQTQFGDINEVFSEAEYESLEAHTAVWEAAPGHSSLIAAFRAMLTHTVEGSLRDYPLKAIPID